LLERTNKERLNVNEKPLKLNKKLDQAAYFKAKNMFAKQYWAHDAPDGMPPWKWLSDVEYNYNKAGENLARNFTSTDAVIIAWMNSSEHKANILNSDYQDVGFAIVNGKIDDQVTLLVVAMYGLSTENTVITTQKPFFSSKLTKNDRFLNKFVVIIQLATPAVMIGLSMLIFTLIVVAIPHSYRKRMPKSLSEAWYYNHVLSKTLCLIFFSLIIVFMYSSGQI